MKSDECVSESSTYDSSAVHALKHNRDPVTFPPRVYDGRYDHVNRSFQTMATVLYSKLRMDRGGIKGETPDLNDNA